MRRALFIAAFGLSAFWPRFADLDDLPRHPLAVPFREEAIAWFWMSHGNPIERAFLRLLVMNLRLSHWRDVPGSCDGGRSTWPQLQEVSVTVTIVGPWGIPLGQETILCGGAAWRR